MNVVKMRCLVVLGVAVVLVPLAGRAAEDVAVGAGKAVKSDRRLKEAIVKIFTIQNPPDYYNPWSMRGSRGITGSGCIIKGKKILTNAHVVSDETFVQVRRYGRSRKVRARVVEVSHDADLALLEVDDDSFFEGIRPLELGRLPEPQQEVMVYGFPLGGDTLSVTKGVVSRIEHRTYVHSSCYLLAGQIDAAINPGNSGGPVIVDGKVAGVVMQGVPQADNIGYMVPVPVIRHFMDDIADGRYDGFPSLGVVMERMENADLRRRYRMPEEYTGMLVVKVVPGSPADGKIEKGDVILEVDGHPVADDGTVEFRPDERTSVAYFIQAHQIGDRMRVAVLREGLRKEIEVKLSRPLEADRLIPMEQYDRLPTYYIFGGLVFCPLTKNLLSTWDGKWYSSAPRELLALLSDNYVTRERDEVVLMLRVLAADVNEGYHDYSNWIISEVNGHKVRNLRDLIRRVEGSQDEFIEFSNDHGQRIVFDRRKAQAACDAILETYHIRADRSPDLASAVEAPSAGSRDAGR